uniref:uncharacterized protein LOC103796433 n=1 Tax=Callithrix jacchus TaxID=9483 RepID=UPI0023DCFE6E|nr:uncharacterized protein LOC103796433 [Callithrix jacchus]XP_054097194.1 uncharacterized protein LOC103796433 [Callithrix jacchus]
MGPGGVAGSQGVYKVKFPLGHGAPWALENAPVFPGAFMYPGSMVGSRSQLFPNPAPHPCRPLITGNAGGDGAPEVPARTGDTSPGLCCLQPHLQVPSCPSLPTPSLSPRCPGLRPAQTCQGAPGPFFLLASQQHSLLLSHLPPPLSSLLRPTSSSPTIPMAPRVSQLLGTQALDRAASVTCSSHLAGPTQLTQSLAQHVATTPTAAEGLRKSKAEERMGRGVRRMGRSLELLLHFLRKCCGGHWIFYSAREPIRRCEKIRKQQCLQGQEQLQCSHTMCPLPPLPVPCACSPPSPANASACQQVWASYYVILQKGN